MWEKNSQPLASLSFDRYKYRVYILYNFRIFNNLSSLFIFSYNEFRMEAINVQCCNN
ncbi:hypothetical protein ES332_A13G240600v1 [Gossypium tomentosum]|uniref:Uncharacterized protein n=1 Tax=Gossypium tomentosum TaxID=34277 RepID=A0A5D2MP33_GOSTO|nr:hypothetical protein ES332_A13G240600v1 [Gossypium tomentosum]